MPTYNELEFSKSSVAMRLTLRFHSRLMASIDRELAGSQTTLTERRILLELMLFPQQTHRALATSLGMTPSQVSRGVKGLLENEMIISEPATHRKQIFLMLSPAGQKLAEELDGQFDIALTNQYHKLDEEGQHNMLSTTVRAEPNPLWVQRHEQVKLEPMTPKDAAWLFSRLIDTMHDIIARDSYAADLAAIVSSYLKQPTYDLPLRSVAYQGPVRLGACLMRHDADDIHSRIALIFVSPEARRKGVGTQLLGQSLKEAKLLTMSRVTAEIPEHQTDVDALLRKSGFTRLRTSKERFLYGISKKVRNYEYDVGLLDGY